MAVMTEKPRHINAILNDLIQDTSDKTRTIGDFIDLLHERGFGILIFLLALPMALPLPVPPGINLLFAVPLMLLTFQQIYGAKKPWLPQRMRQKEFQQDKITHVITKARPWLDRLSVFIQPRMGFVTQGVFSKLIGVFGFIFALCICIPIPLTNTVPSFAIVLMALGILMRDGLAVLTGMIVGSFWVLLLATLGVTGFKALINMIIGG